MQVDAEQQAPNVEEHLTQPSSPVREVDNQHQRRPARLPASVYQANIFPFRPRRPHHFISNVNVNTPQQVQETNTIREAYTRHALKHQMEYYFSLENLCRDLYLRSHMNEEGWIDLSFIAQFNRVKFFSADMEYIADSLCDSQVVEVAKRGDAGYQIRKLGDWAQWCLTEDLKKGTLERVQAKQGTLSGHAHSHSR
jgi:La domain-containing protein